MAALVDWLVVAAVLGQVVVLLLLLRGPGEEEEGRGGGEAGDFEFEAEKK